MTYHLIQQPPWPGKRIGPFSTEMDAKLARSIASKSWETATVESQEEFEKRVK